MRDDESTETTFIRLERWSSGAALRSPTRSPSVHVRATRAALGASGGVGHGGCIPTTRPASSTRTAQPREPRPTTYFSNRAAGQGRCPPAVRCSPRSSCFFAGSPDRPRCPLLLPSDGPKHRSTPNFHQARRGRSDPARSSSAPDCNLLTASKPRAPANHAPRVPSGPSHCDSLSCISGVGKPRRGGHAVVALRTAAGATLLVHGQAERVTVSRGAVPNAQPTPPPSQPHPLLHTTCRWKSQLPTALDLR